MKCAKTRAYCSPIVERPSGSCVVLTGSLAGKESLLCHCDKVSLPRRKKREQYILVSVSLYWKEEGSKKFEVKIGPLIQTYREELDMVHLRLHLDEGFPSSVYLRSNLPTLVIHLGPEMKMIAIF